MKTAFIYTLSDPRNNRVRYVGKTNDPYTRLAGHISDAKKNNSYVRNWIGSLGKQELKPLMAIVELATPENWQERERFWIAFYRAVGAILCNHTDGGEGLVNPSESTKEKQRANNRRNAATYKTPEFRAKISALSKALVRTPEHCERIAASKRGKPRSPETVAKMAEGKRKPVGKFDVTGNLICQYPTSKECAIENGVDRKYLIKKMKLGKPAKGVIYRYL